VGRGWRIMFIAGSYSTRYFCDLRTFRKWYNFHMASRRWDSTGAPVKFVSEIMVKKENLLSNCWIGDGVSLVTRILWSPAYAHQWRNRQSLHHVWRYRGRQTSQGQSQSVARYRCRHVTRRCKWECRVQCARAQRGDMFHGFDFRQNRCNRFVPSGPKHRSSNALRCVVLYFTFGARSPIRRFHKFVRARRATETAHIFASQSSTWTIPVFAPSPNTIHV
jgi:hypothetical protein